MCIFESATVKSDCPMQENYKIFKDLIQTVGLLLLVLLFVLEILKKENKTSENNQLTGHFQSFFSFFFCPP